MVFALIGSCAMRDIRDDLRERLDGLRQERDRLQVALQAKLKEIAAYEEQLNTLLEMEEKRVAAATPSFDFDIPVAITPPDISASPKDKLESVILVLLDGGVILPHADIKDRLEEAGFAHGHRHFGRMLQGTLMSMRSRELIDLVPRGKWRRRLGKPANAA
jgi:hypothetical protein